MSTRIRSGARIPRASFVLASVVAVWAAACSDDPVGPDEHAEPVEVRLTLGGVEIASATQSTATGAIDLEAGQETGHITVEYLDQDGDVIDLHGEEFYLEVDVLDESVAEFEQDTPGEFGGHAHGIAEGETLLTFKLMHGSVGTGHPDFTPKEITLRVEAAGG